MKKRQLLCLILSVLMLCSLLAGCGGSSGTRSHGAYESVTMDSAASEEAGNGLYASKNGENGTLPENRKWIVTVHMSAETDDLDGMTAFLNTRIEEMGGYVESQHIYNGSSYANYRYRSASMTIRIPAADVDKFTSDVSGVANVVSQEKTLQDVTLNYVATENRIKALQAEEARLLELLAEAENMTDLLEIEGRLTDVRYELETVMSQKRLYDNQIDYATIYLNIEEVQEYTPVEEPSLWERISTGFVRNLKGLGEGAVDLLVWIITASPYLVTYGIVLAVVISVIRRIRKKKVRKNKKAESAEETKPNEAKHEEKKDEA